MDVLEILRCPRTGNKLRPGDEDSVVCVEGFAIRRQGNFKSFVYFEAVKTALTGA